MSQKTNMSSCSLRSDQADKVNSSWKPPTGKHCAAKRTIQPAAATMASTSQPHIPGPPHPRVPANWSPVEVLPVGTPARTVEESMDLLATRFSTIP